MGYKFDEIATHCNSCNKEFDLTREDINDGSEWCYPSNYFKFENCDFKTVCIPCRSIIDDKITAVVREYFNYIDNEIK